MATGSSEFCVVSFVTVANCWVRYSGRTAYITHLLTCFRAGAKSVDVLLRDDGELPELSEALPRKWGLPPSPVQLQCLTSSKDVLVIGTNHSMIVVYNLRSQVTDKISLEVRT